MPLKSRKPVYQAANPVDQQVYEAAKSINQHCTIPLKSRSPVYQAAKSVNQRSSHIHKSTLYDATKITRASLQSS